MPRTGRGGEPDEVVDPHDGRSDPGRLPDGDPASILRRAPFSENPLVGIRGQQAQQRILDAALQVFDEVGYHQCGVVRITEVAGCSRASFYQYFSSKEDVFRHLAGQVGRQLMASADVLRPMTPDAAGWSVIRAWVDRHTAIYARYEPVFEAFQAAAESDDAVASNSVRILHRHVASVRARVTATTLPSRQVDPVIELLLHLMTRTPRFAAVLRNALPDQSLDEQRVNSAITDLIHRTLFGLDPSVNVQPAPTTPPAQVPDGAALLSGLQRDAAGGGAHACREPDPCVAARGRPRGTRHEGIPRHPDRRHHRRGRDVARSVLPVLREQGSPGAAAGYPSCAARLPLLRRDTGHRRPPGAGEHDRLRAWLRKYVSAQASEAAMIRVWMDATADDAILSLESAAALDWGRTRMMRFLRPRRFGDIGTEGLLMVVLLDAAGARQSPELLDAATQVIERGMLGSTDAT